MTNRVTKTSQERDLIRETKKVVREGGDGDVENMCSSGGGNAMKRWGKCDRKMM